MIQRIVVSAIVVFFVVIFLGVANADPLNDEAWQAVTPLNVARYQFTGGIMNGQIYVFGGRGTRNLKSTEMYNPLTNKWSSKASNQNAVEELTGATVNDKLYVFGAKGGGDPYVAVNFVEEYDPVTNTWTSKASKPTPVSGAPAALYNGEIYLFGGMYDYDSDSGSAIYSDVVEAYNPVTDTWRFITSIPAKIGNMAVAVSGSTAYLIGGIYADGNNAATDVIAYNFETSEWIISGLGLLSKPRGFVYSRAAPAVNGKIYLIGGWTSDKWTGIKESDTMPTDDVQIYNTATRTFAQGIPLPQATDKHLAVFLNNSLYVIGGSTGRNASGSDIRTNAVWRLQLLCTDNDGDGYAVGVGDCGPADCDDNNPLINSGAEDSNCNGIDENCDGTADNNYVPAATSCGVGACAATGQLICQSGVETDTCIAGTPAENSELICDDSQDNDCDGLTDAGDPDCLALPDLTVGSISDPPAQKRCGGKFHIKDSVSNQGEGRAGKSVTKYYLSSDTVRDDNDILLKGRRVVSELDINAVSDGTRPVKLFIPVKASPGDYYLIACADDRNSINESDDTNNCMASQTMIKVKR
ncbi:MAG: hypothetical protein HZB30_09860 [Nitrospirae bacterium]|nr:hypothetical protein [Nitrospirota bacterium]